MKFALFYEIPVAKPWSDRSEYWAYRHTLEQAILADRLGFHSVWTVKHQVVDSGGMEHLTFAFLKGSGSAVVGDPDRCIEIAKRYEKAGCDLLLCLVNPYKIPHEKVMQSIELMGKHVLPAFK